MSCLSFCCMTRDNNNCPDCVCCPGKCCKRNIRKCSCKSPCCDCQCIPVPKCGNCLCEYREQERCPGYFCLTLVHPLCVSNCTSDEEYGACHCCKPVPRGIIQKNALRPVSGDNRHALLHQITCPLCKKMYQNPFILPCKHCICRACVERIKSNKDNHAIITCPVCEEAHYFASKDHMRLPENYLLNKIIQKYGPEYGDPSLAIQCQRCQPRNRKKAVLKCTVCNVNYCEICVRYYHSSKEFRTHVLTENLWDVEEAKYCFYHPLQTIMEYCMTDRKLVCKHCKSIFHKDHNCLSLLDASTEEAQTLFAAIAKAKRVKCLLENDLMEINLVNAKSYKDNRKRDIRHGFVKLHDILQEKEKELLGTVENIEHQKQIYMTDFQCDSSNALQNIDGIIAYSKEALKEENPITFLQSANALVKDIERQVLKTYEPDSTLKDDPVKYLKLDFEQIASSLRALFPQPNFHLVPGQSYTSVTGESPRFTVSGRLVPSKSHTSLRSYTDQVSRTDFLTEKEAYVRPKSTPPNFWGQYQYSDGRNIGNDTEKSLPHEPPRPVIINKTIIYPHAVKIFWISPPEKVDFYDAEFQELGFNQSAEDLLFEDFTEKKYGIKQQSIELNNLKPNSEYVFKVRGVNLAGEGEWSAIIKITTPDSADQPNVFQRMRNMFS